mmetsp:Transcript_40074/g.129256  ORF Transcript_40074/g.129256 Transcript_40074/m.129256 type:complete len:327 (-) Transcript_40074:44-1024(-)
MQGCSAALRRMPLAQERRRVGVRDSGGAPREALVLGDLPQQAGEVLAEAVDPLALGQPAEQRERVDGEQRRAADAQEQLLRQRGRRHRLVEQQRPQLLLAALCYQLERGAEVAPVAQREGERRPGGALLREQVDLRVDEPVLLGHVERSLWLVPARRAQKGQQLLRRQCCVQLDLARREGRRGSRVALEQPVEVLVQPEGRRLARRRLELRDDGGGREGRVAPREEQRERAGPREAGEVEQPVESEGVCALLAEKDKDIGLPRGEREEQVERHAHLAPRYRQQCEHLGERALRRRQRPLALRRRRRRRLRSRGERASSAPGPSPHL